MITVKYLKSDSDALNLALSDRMGAEILDFIAEDKYKDMARIDTDDFEVAYAKMQNGVESPSWTLEPPAGLTPLAPPVLQDGRTLGNRSSMIGDLYVRDDGSRKFVNWMGFRDI
jgi:hypothetical protein